MLSQRTSRLRAFLLVGTAVFLLGLEPGARPSRTRVEAESATSHA